ncbi:MAG TPA: hypothetical protein VMX17_13705 [Candidatus Glassbacteria bacterium]|nr:hypothetical protein [Candidatus Glassbacteria bacterium]
MSIKKSSIQQALIEAREIEKSAIDNAKKALEEELAPKIKQVAIDALKEYEQETINEDVTITIATDGGETIETPEISNDELETPETLGDENEIADDELSSDENNNIDNLGEMDIFEIDGLDETEDMAQPEAGTAPAEMPNPEGVETPEGEMAAEAPAVEAEAATIETVNQKLDDVLSKLDSISSEESVEDGQGEGDVEIIDDQPAAEAPAGPPAELPAPAPAPTPALQEDDLFEYELDDEETEEVVYEMEDDSNMEEEVMFEFEDEEENTLDIFNETDINEIEIVDEDEASFDAEEDSTMEEMLGVGQNLRHSNRLAKLPRQGVKHRSEINENKAQNESKNDELLKENESLKQTIKEYKESFVVLRKQINEVQIFNAKLAYANKLFTNGGLTNDEKIKIAEDFDKVQTIEEAKKLYNTFLSEMKISKSPKSTPIDKLKSSSPSVVSSSNSQTLFESDEMRRMKRLAGIGKKIEG